MIGLFSSVFLNDYKTVLYHTHNKENLNKKYGIFNTTLLHLAVLKNYYKVSKLLLKHKAKVNARNISGDTPLFFAVYNNNLSLVKLLIKNRANIHVRNNCRDFPLMWACRKVNFYNSYLNYNRNPIKIIKLLLKKDINSRNSRGMTPLISCQYVPQADTNTTRAVNYNLIVVKLLLKNGANVNYRDLKGEDAIYYAMIHEREIVLSYLTQWKKAIIIQKNFRIYFK